MLNYIYKKDLAPDFKKSQSGLEATWFGRKNFQCLKPIMLNFSWGIQRKEPHQNLTTNKKLTFENLKISFWPLLKKRSRLDHPKSIPTCILYLVSLR